ncbi:MAG: multidrug effflux MFS transporter [Proteobacteria bacterium]|nr:multidrug effflux MFS transporter [Pseudomonadota bacterium]
MAPAGMAALPGFAETVIMCPPAIPPRVCPLKDLNLPNRPTSPPDTIPGDKPRLIVVALLMTLGTLGQLAINIILPSLPALGRELAPEPGSERLVLSVFLIGFSVGQLLVGPLSDRFGRRRILLPGLLLYALLGAATILTQSFGALLWARGIQGLGAAAGFVVARAIARDMFDGPKLIKIFGMITLAMGFIPGLSPILGGVLQEAVGWQANMAVTAVAGFAILALTWAFMPETGKPSERAFTPATVIGGYMSIIRERTFRRFAGTNAMTLGALYAFHAGGPALMIDYLGLTPSTFGFVALAHSGCYILGGITITRLSERVNDPGRVAAVGALVMSAAAAFMLALGLTGSAGVINITVSMMVYGFSLGVVLSVGVAGALGPFKERAGAATALLGALQMTAGGIASATIAAIDGHPAIVFSSVILIMAVLGTINAARR